MYRVGLLVDSPVVSKSVYDVAKWVQDQQDIELAALIVLPPQANPGRLKKFIHLAQTLGIIVALSRVAFACVLAVEQKLLMRGKFSEYRRSFNISGLATSVITTGPQISKSGFVYTLGESDLQAVRALQLDLLVRAGSGILKGEILSAARCGVLSMHHGDNRINRGGPAGFWEVLLRQPETGFVVQRLTEELDGGDVLFRGSITTQPFYSLNQATLLQRSTVHQQRMIRRLLDGSYEVEHPHLYDGQLFRAPGFVAILSYISRTAALVATRVWRRVVGRKWHWGVAYRFCDWEDAVLRRFERLPCPAGGFIADPFVIERDGTHYIFVEEYRYREKKGVISAYQVDKRSARPLGVVLEGPSHLSFPFLFEYDGETYMVPETSEAGQIQIYVAADFPKGWRLHHVAMSNVVANDTVLFPHDGKWWLLTTIAGSPFGSNDAELHAFSSDTPFGEWTAHARNPVVMDASRARNGGLLKGRNGDIYRIGQRHRFAQYGAGFAIYRINVLTDDEYSEQLIQEIRPNFFPDLDGTHHLHHTSGLTVVDYLRDERPS